jgi:ParB-like nuclease family protein
MPPHLAVRDTPIVPGKHRCPTCGQPTDAGLMPPGGMDAGWIDPFTGAAAWRAAVEGRLEEWVHRWLLGAGRNVPMFRGLSAYRQWWLGPVGVPVQQLIRIVGPEPGMPFPRHQHDWVPRLDGIADSIRGGWDVPPVVAEYRDAGLVVNDGNHRYAAQCRMGCGTVSAIVRFDSEDAWRRFRPAWAAGAPREAGRVP